MDRRCVGLRDGDTLHGLGLVAVVVIVALHAHRHLLGLVLGEFEEGLGVAAFGALCDGGAGQCLAKLAVETLVGHLVAVDAVGAPGLVRLALIAELNGSLAEEVVDDTAAYEHVAVKEDAAHDVHPDLLLPQDVQGNGHVAIVVEDVCVGLVGGRHVQVVHADQGDPVHILHNPGPLDAPLDGVWLAPHADEGEHGSLDVVLDRGTGVDFADEALGEVQRLLQVGDLHPLGGTQAPGDVVVRDDVTVKQVPHGHHGV